MNFLFYGHFDDMNDEAAMDVAKNLHKIHTNIIQARKCLIHSNKPFAWRSTEQNLGQNLVNIIAFRMCICTYSKLK